MSKEETRKVKAAEENTKREISEKELEKVVGGSTRGVKATGFRRR